MIYFRDFLFMSQNIYSFSKKERLSNKKSIALLFEKGNSFWLHSFSVVWCYSDRPIPFPAQMAVSVTKKSFKRAVDRNKIKRLVREAWRLNKNNLYDLLKEKEKQIIIMLVFTGKKIPDFYDVNNHIKNVISKISLLLSDPENHGDKTISKAKLT